MFYSNNLPSSHEIKESIAHYLKDLSKKRKYPSPPHSITSKSNFRLEDINLIQQYGPSVYSFSLQLDSYQIPYSSIYSFSYTSRVKIINWMLTVFSSYNSEPSSFFIAVYLFDQFISKSHYHINDEDLHLIGLVCIYIASKMEDITPLHMSHIKTQIAHDKFEVNDIQRMEKEILKTINFSLICTHTYDFIRTYLYDFSVNNKDKIEEFEMRDTLKAFEEVCVYLAKMITLDEELMKYQHSMQAICCIIAAFDILRSNAKNFGGQRENFLRQWIAFLIKESTFNVRIVAELYEKVVDYYQKISLTHNLKDRKHKKGCKRKGSNKLYTNKNVNKV